MKHCNLRSARVFMLMLVLGICGCKEYVPGPKGEQGEAGKKGNLKITTITTTPDNWTTINNGWKAHSIVPQITDSVLNKGDVDVYVKMQDRWWKLPFAEGELVMQVKIEKGYLHYNYARIHDLGPPQPVAINFKVIISESIN